MPGPDVFQEANRQLIICNACRYCEGYCPVFRAIETRRDFNKGDVFYLSNLCHDCRACYYACMFTPPHEFAVNIPKILADGLFAIHLGPGAFYTVVPYIAMVIGGLVLFFYAIAVWMRGGARFWSETRSVLHHPGGLKAFAAALTAALGLRYLKGGGPGCFYPGDRPSSVRRFFHALTSWGLLADFVATTLAFIYQDFFHRLPPYAFTSAPVIFGSVGGVALIDGTGGLIWFKLRSDRQPG